ncbi:MAG: phage tail protein [Alistipes indistinctus]
MADREQDRTWPLAQFYFKVRIAGLEAAFKEVSGLVLKDQAVEYRHDDAPGFSTIKMPGIIKTSNVILKNGLFKKQQ